MDSIKLQLEQNQYSVYIGSGLLNQAEFLKQFISGKQLLIVTNATIASLYLQQFKNNFQGLQCDVVILPDGEQYKTLQTLNQIFDTLLQQKHHRNTTLFALGGGVIGDMTGFAAACYMRGVKYLQVPTTLLAQVDSAIGGKTGVNHPLGKNMIGAFYQPAAVIADIETLSSLPHRVFVEGIAEIIKYGLIQDAEFFDWLELNIDKLLQKDVTVLQQAIYRSGKIKASLIMADEKEQGVRALLNLGHTFGHAIENGLGYGQWLHGEAVGLGLLIAADLSSRLGWLNADVVARIKKLLIKIDLPIRLPEKLTVAQILELMSRDKKNINGHLRLIVLKGIGHAEINDQISSKIIEEVLQDYK